MTTASGKLRRRPRRWWLFLPFDLLARFWPVLRPRRGVLVVRIDGIGDMVLFHSAFAHYAQALDIAPSEITVLGCKSWAAIAPVLFRGCRFHAIDEHAYDRRPLYRLAVSLWVRRQGFAVAICDIFMRKPLVADSLVYVSGAPRCIVSKPYVSSKTQRVFDWYLARCHRIIDTGPYPTHEIVRHFRFVSELGGRPVPPQPPRLPWPRQSEPPHPRPYAVINFGSNEPGRRWGFDHFLALAGTLIDRGLDVVFIGAASDAAYRDRLMQSAQAMLRGDHIVDRIGRTSLPELLGLLQHAAIVVSNDTGPAHLAIGLGAPTLVLVGGGHFGSFVPYPESLTPKQVGFLFRQLPCFHCFWRCTEPHERGGSFPCVESILEDDVTRAVAERLAPLHFVPAQDPALPARLRPEAPTPP